MSRSRTKLAVALGIMMGAADPRSVLLAGSATSNVRSRLMYTCPPGPCYGGASYRNYISDMAGVFAYSSIGNFTPRSGMCILLATSFESFASGTTQNEIGLYSCNGSSIGGSCNQSGARKYFEATYGTTHNCTDQGPAATQTAYTMQTYVTGTAADGTDIESSYIAGALAGSQQHFSPGSGSNTPLIWEGEEVTFLGSPFPCDSSWKGSGSWTSIEYEQRSTGAWKTVTAATPVASCVSYTAFSSSGGFSAYH
jgi:hypothetical protein